MRKKEESYHCTLQNWPEAPQEAFYQGELCEKVIITGSLGLNPEIADNDTPTFLVHRLDLQSLEDQDKKSQMNLRINLGLLENQTVVNSEHSYRRLEVGKPLPHSSLENALEFGKVDIDDTSEKGETEAESIDLAEVDHWLDAELAPT